jgi:hypothetical protein
MLVGNEEITVKRILHRQPVLNAPDKMTKMKLPGGRIAGENAGAIRFGAHEANYKAKASGDEERVRG